MKENSFQDKLQDESINLREQIDSYFKYWPWFLFSVIITLFFSFLYLRYTQPQYKAVATILVKDDRKGNFQSELSSFNDLGLMNTKNNVDNEIEVIKSRSILEKAIKKLKVV
jgi:tyrosine-protein kinase Etk/Wzc